MEKKEKNGETKVRMWIRREGNEMDEKECSCENLTASTIPRALAPFQPGQTSLSLVNFFFLFLFLFLSLFFFFLILFLFHFLFLF
jgi:hypothetical protein